VFRLNDEIEDIQCLPNITGGLLSNTVCSRYRYMSNWKCRLVENYFCVYFYFNQSAHKTWSGFKQYFRTENSIRKNLTMTCPFRFFWWNILLLSSRTCANR